MATLRKLHSKLFERAMQFTGRMSLKGKGSSAEDLQHQRRKFAHSAGACWSSSADRCLMHRSDHRVLRTRMLVLPSQEGFTDIERELYEIHKLVLSSRTLIHETLIHQHFLWTPCLRTFQKSWFEHF